MLPDLFVVLIDEGAEHDSLATLAFVGGSENDWAISTTPSCIKRWTELAHATARDSCRPVRVVRYVQAETLAEVRHGA